MSTNNTSNRRKFLKGGVAGAAVTAAAAVPAVKAQEKPTKKVFGRNPNAKNTPLFSNTVGYGNLIFVSGVGAHVPGDITVHTKIVLEDLKKRLEAAGSSMEKCLKATVYLANGKDYAEMNKVFQGAFGPEPPVRTTVAAAWIPGDSLVEIDVIAYI
jgi:enamine deaminase RidA (YjgF/YER057c/UK114 family)